MAVWTLCFGGERGERKRRRGGELRSTQREVVGEASFGVWLGFGVFSEATIQGLSRQSACVGVLLGFGWGWYIYSFFLKALNAVEDLFVGLPYLVVRSPLTLREAPYVREALLPKVTSPHFW